jgi:glycosyltransferase involved in cell wall biosynthesis
VNVLFTLTAYPPSTGGAQLLMHQLAQQLQKRHTVQVVAQWDTARTDWLFGTTLNAPAPALAYEIDGVPVQRITLSPVERVRLRPWVWLYFPLQRWALKHISAALAAEIAPYAERADLIHNCRIGREGLSYGSLRAARRRGLPFVLTPVHHPRWGGWLHRYFHQLYREADAVIALTETERRTLIQLGVRPERVHVTGMGPVLAEHGDGARFRAQHDLGAEPMVLFVGQKYAYKGLATLLAAVPHVPEARFVFIGPRTAYSRKLFATIHNPRVLELDAVDVQTKTDAFAACDVFCLPSTQESFGGVFTEAWSLGKPVVGADIPAVREVIAEGVDGYCVPAQPGPLAERLCFLLDQAQVRTAMGERGRTKVAARYSWPRLAELTEQVYRHALGDLR